VGFSFPRCPRPTTLPRRRLLLVAAAHVAATLSLASLFPSLGQTAGVFGLLAVLAGAWSFGLRGGVVATAFQAVLNAVVMGYVIDPPQQLTGSSLLALAVFFGIGAAVGNQRDLSWRLSEQLARNEELRVRERETLAAIPDVMVHVGPDGSCRLRGVSVSGTLGEVLERGLGSDLGAERRGEIARMVDRVRGSGAEEVTSLELPGAVAFDVRCLPAAEGAVLVLVRDVSEQRRLLRRVTAAENLASLGTLAAGLAHEINNPLTYVVTGVSAIRASLAAGERIEAAEVDSVLDGCWRVRDIVRNILDTSARGKDGVEAVAVPEAIDAALALVRAQVSHRATIHWSPDEVPLACAHRTKLIEVVVNLVVNAGQAFTDNRVSQNQIRIRARGEAGEVVIEVEDNGPGMDEATRLRALEPFFTTKDPGQGTGLGLFLSSAIVESLGGTLHIDSEVGQGTRVTVRLPVAQEPPASGVVRRSIPVVAGEATARARVLVVDDEPEIRRALRRIVGQRHDVTLAANGAEAWQLLAAGERFDVVFCDILMPEVTGIELYRALQEAIPDQAARVVFITGGATSEAARAFLEEHGGRVVHKPFRPSEIEATVAALAASAAAGVDAQPVRPSVAPA